MRAEKPRRSGGDTDRNPDWLNSPLHESDARQAPLEVERLLRVSMVHLAADNPVAALECLEQAEVLLGEAEAAIGMQADVKLRIADALQRRGELQAMFAKVSEVLTLLGPSGHPVLRGKALWRAGQAHSGLGRYDRGLQACEEAYELLRSTDEHAELGFLELVRGMIHFRRGDVGRSRECFESGLFCFRRIDHREGIALALNALGLLLKNGPHWADARDYLIRALGVSEASGNYARVATHSVNLGILYTKLCDWEAAERHLARAISINREVGSVFALTKTLLAMGILHRRRDRRDLASALYAEAREICEQRNYGRELALCHEAEGDLLADEGRRPEARRQYERGLKLAREVAPEGDLVPEIQRRLAALALRDGDLGQARRLAADSFRRARRLGEACEAGAALRLLGEVLSLKGNLPAGGRLLERSLQMLGRTPERYEFALTQLALGRHLGRVWRRRGPAPEGESPARAIDLAQKAWAFFASAELPHCAAEALLELAHLRIILGKLDEALRDLARAHGLIEPLGRGDLVRRLEALRGLLEERSAQTAHLSSPEASLISEWSQLFSGEGAHQASLERMLRFVREQLESSVACIAYPDRRRGMQIEAAVGCDPPEAQRLLRAAVPHVGENGICLAADLGADPRFEGEAEQTFAGVRSLVALRLRLPDSEGILYLDRREAGTAPYGAPDLRVLSVLQGLLGLGLTQIRRERDLVRRRDAEADAQREGPFAAYITSHRPLLQVFGHLARVGDSTASILILGETGTGKGLLAQCIHDASRRGEKPFVSVNCAALPESLLESELFGHVQGSFTGAHRTKRGLFEEADGGTIFLDEISRASLAVQAKLLHVLDSREVRPVGANRGRVVDVRVICASNMDPREAIREGRFLEDLFYRLNDFNVQLPPLRARREDISLLVKHFIQEASRELDRHPSGMTREVTARLLDHEWRGNIRELMQVVRRLVALSEDGEWITPDLLPPDFLKHAAPAERLRRDGEASARSAGRQAGELDEGGLHAEVAHLERALIAELLEATRWNRSEAARRLRISYPSLLAKIKRYDLHPPAGTR